MLIRNSVFFVILNSLIWFSGQVHGQQKVDLDKALADDPELFSGNFTRVGIGISRSNFSYGTSFDGILLNPLHVNLDLGKRMSRNFGAYFTFTGDFLLSPKSLAFDRINQWIQAGLNVGGLYYFTGGNSYVATEAGFGLMIFEYEDSQFANPDKPICTGLSASLRYGHDWHVAGTIFLGGQICISYAHTWETGVPEGTESQVAGAFIYGVAVSLKIGK